MIPGVHNTFNLMERAIPNKLTGCWEWTGSRVCIGYGRLSYKGKLRLAHRLIMHLIGYLDEEQFNNPKCIVMHTCDNPPCINPYHLRIGTQQENIRDRKLKGRSASHIENRDKLGRFKKKIITVR